eukprot:SAG11_NODE_2323_length_3523_cov_5.707652_4_plen_203_part_00
MEALNNSLQGVYSLLNRRKNLVELRATCESNSPKLQPTEQQKKLFEYLTRKLDGFANNHGLVSSIDLYFKQVLRQFESESQSAAFKASPRRPERQSSSQSRRQSRRRRSRRPRSRGRPRVRPATVADMPRAGAASRRRASRSRRHPHVRGQHRTLLHSDLLRHRVRRKMRHWALRGAGRAVLTWLREGVKLNWRHKPPPPFH